MASNWTGLYLGTDNVDVVTLSGSFQKPKLVSFGRVQLPPEISWRNLLKAEEGGADVPEAPTPSPESAPLLAISGPIQSLLEKVGGPTGKIQTALASESVVIRYFQMPTIPPHERKLAVAFEAKKYLPFKLEELVTDYQIVTHRSDPTLMRVMFFGIKKNALDTILSLMGSVQLNPLCLEPAPVSLMRLLRHNGQLPTGEVAAVLYLEKDTAAINISRNDLLYLSRNVSTVAAEGASEEDHAAELLDALINETRVSIDYYRRRFLGEPSVSKVILFGQELDAKRVEELTSALELPVELGNPFQGMSDSKNAPGGLAVAAGLALRGLEKQPGVINLLPATKRGQEENLLKPFVMQAAAAALVLAAWYGLSAFDMGGWEKSLQSVRASQVAVDKIAPGTPIVELRSIRMSYKKRVGFFEQLTQQAGLNAALLSGVTRLLPKQTWLEYALLKDSFKQRDPKNPLSVERRRVLRLSGWAFANNRDLELSQVNGFLETIGKDDLFKRAFSAFSMDSVQRGEFFGEQVTEFKFSCATDPSDIKEEQPIGGRRRRRRR